MIEVEKKFQPTKEQLQSLLEGAEYLGHETHNDVYYDYPDFRFLKKKIRLRERNGSLELKIRVAPSSDLEIKNIGEIEEYLKENFGVDLGAEEFIKKDLVEIMKYKTEREKYRKDGFDIDVDELDFGYEMCEIELMVQNMKDTQEAKKRIKDFARSYDFEAKKPLSKGAEYLRRFNPEKYKEIYSSQENSKEKKNIFNIFKMK